MKKIIEGIVVFICWLVLGAWLYIHATSTTIETRYLATLVVWGLECLHSLTKKKD